MDLTLDERQLLADFRRLPAGGQKELLDYVAFLAGRQHRAADAPTSGATNQCRLDSEEARPEADIEPISTE